MNKLPDYDELHRLFCYDPETGVVTRKVRTANRTKVGDVINTKNKNGYILVTINSKRFYLHRIIWKMMTGEDPNEKLVDHKDLNKTNNTWHNLRLCTKRENNLNSKHLNVGQSCLPKGVMYSKERNCYWVRIQGCAEKWGFKTPYEAHEYYKLLADEYHGEFANYG